MAPNLDVVGKEGHVPRDVLVHMIEAYAQVADHGTPTPTKTRTFRRRPGVEVMGLEPTTSTLRKWQRSSTAVESVQRRRSRLL